MFPYIIDKKISISISVKEFDNILKQIVIKILINMQQHMHIDVSNTSIQVDYSQRVLLTLLIDSLYESFVIPIDFPVPCLSWGFPLVNRNDLSVLKVYVVNLTAGVELDIVVYVNKNKHIVEVVTFVFVSGHNNVVFLSTVIEL